jgi:phage head maturation protease
MSKCLDKVRGYAAVWGASTSRFEDGKRPFYEIIERGALTWFGECSVNFDHCGKATLATCRTKDLRIWEDHYGLAFEAELPQTVIGAGARKAFSNRMRSLGVSPSLKVFGREIRSADHDAIVRAQLVHVSLTDNPRFPLSFAWLASAEPLSPEARVAWRHWNLGTIAASRVMMAATRRRPEPILIDGLTPMELFCSPRCGAVRAALTLDRRTSLTGRA